MQETPPTPAIAPAFLHARAPGLTAIDKRKIHREIKHGKRRERWLSQTYPLFTIRVSALSMFTRVREFLFVTAMELRYNQIGGE
jgi:hypothetical protein